MLATMVASSVLVVEEVRKLMWRLLGWGAR
jgi:hypothetical protein